MEQHVVATTPIAFTLVNKSGLTEVGHSTP
jgi:hypothetical protein